MKEGWKYFCRFVFICFTVLYNTNFMFRLKFNIFSLYLKQKYSLTVQIVCNLQRHPTFHSEERLVNLLRGRECFVGLFILINLWLVYRGGCFNDTAFKL